MSHPPPLRLLTTLPRKIDAVVCSGAVANAARSVREDELRAAVRLDAAAAVRELEHAAYQRSSG